MSSTGRSTRKQQYSRCQPSLLVTFLALGLLTTHQPQQQSSFLFAHAQPQPYFTPIAVSAPAFARTITKLYVAGGAWAVSPDIKSRQFMSLDLLLPFTSTAPAWAKLADGPLQRLFPAAFSADEKVMYVFHVDGTNSPWQYDVKEDRWQEVEASTARFQNAGWEGIGAVTDPTTGLIYLAGGYDDISAKARALKVLNIFDPVSQTIHTEDLPAPERAFPVRWYYGNVWSRNRSSVIYWGGNNRTPNQPLGPVENGVTELLPSSMGWYTIPIQGVAPAVRADHCMAANEDGTIIVIYGGRLRNSSIVGELWILDVVNYTWTQGNPGPLRMYAACTIAGDQFLLWGGSTSQNVVAPGEMLIYNLTAGEYQKEYTPPEWYKNMVPPPALSRTTAPWAMPGQEGTIPHGGDDGSGSVRSGNGGHGGFSAASSGAVAGGVIAGMAVVGLIVGLFFMRQRRKREGQAQCQEGEKTGQSGQGGDDGYGANGQEVAERGEPWRNDPQTFGRHDPQGADVNHSIVDRTLQELVEQQRELEQKRQLLILKHQGLAINNATPTTASSSETELPQQQQQPVRSPAFFGGAKTEYVSPPPPTPASIPLPPSTVVSPEAFYTDILQSTAALNKKPTVHSVPGLQGPFSAQGNGYVNGYEGPRPGFGGRRESERTQGSSLMVGSSNGEGGSVQGLARERRGSGGGGGMYADAAMDWVHQQQQLQRLQQQQVQHPHASVDPVFQYQFPA